MDASIRTLVAIATYNEIANLPSLVGDLSRILPDADVLVVDDNSPDGTGRWCREESTRNRRLHSIHRPAKSGLGTATVDAMKYAIANDYAYLVTMDADFSHDPKYVPMLLDAMSPHDGPRLDVCIGSRYVSGGSTEGWHLRRRLMSRWMNVYARYLLGLGPKDCSGAFRCFRVEALAGLRFSDVRSRGYSFQEEILYLLKQRGARFGEIPIHFRNRQQGRSKINAGEAVTALRIIFRLGLNERFGV